MLGVIMKKKFSLCDECKKKCGIRSKNVIDCSAFISNDYDRVIITNYQTVLVKKE